VAGHVSDMVKGLPINPINSSLNGKCGSLEWGRKMGIGDAGENAGVWDL
jgi:hypothetical protein